jgi:hypothetical protein
LAKQLEVRGVVEDKSLAGIFIDLNLVKRVFQTGKKHGLLPVPYL